MKLYSWTIMISICLSLLSGCANNSNGYAPTLHSNQAHNLPTGGSDAALAAAKTY